MTEYLLAIDVGTSALHCLLTDTRTQPIASVQAPISYYTPIDCSTLGREIDPQFLLGTVESLIASLLRQQNVASREIVAIGVTSQRQAVAFLDSDGLERYLSPNVDLRAVFEGASIDYELGDHAYRTTGHFPSFMLAAARLRWLRQHRPEVLALVTCLLPLASWLAFRFTGNLVTEISLDAEAGLIDIHTRQRNPDFLQRLGISPSLLPPIVPAGVCVGGLTPSLASRMGLQAGIPIAIAGPDTQCGLMGMGVAHAGQTGAVLGWSGSLQVVTPEPCLDEKMRTWVGCYPAGGLWVAEANLGDSGNAYLWLKSLLLGKEATFDQAEALAMAVPPGSEGLVALIGPGPDTAPKMGLREGGFVFPVPQIFKEATPGELLRATMENLAYGVKSNLFILREVTGYETDTLWVGGGMASSKGFMQLLADVLGKPVACSLQPQVAGRGAALAAAISFGSYSTFEEAVGHLGRCYQVHEPKPPTSAEYEEHFMRWLEIAGRLSNS